MRTIVMSIGGSILLTGEDDTKYISDLVKVILGLVQDGVKVGLVVGGGRLAREYIRYGRDLGKEELYLDQIGIMATRLNSMILLSGFKDGANDVPFLDVDSAVTGSQEFNPVIMGGTVVGQTTDAVAAELAERLKADIFINATAVDGVYEADPRKNPQAKRFDNLTFQQLMDIVGDSLEAAGTNIVIDPMAAKIIERSTIRTIVLNGRDLDNLSNALKGGEFRGTIIDS
jgi:uridylate kinase